MTAEELFGKHFNGMHYDDITNEKIEQYAIDFAKYHVEQALQAAIEEVPYGSSTDTVSYKDVKGILTCYPLDNIK